MVGSAIVRQLRTADKYNISTVDKSKVDLLDQIQTREFIAQSRPDVIIIAAARVGGILANRDYPYNFIAQNLQIQSNLIEAAKVMDVQQVIFLGSSCIFPKFAEQPIKESSLLTAALEPTNQWYAIAKIAGIKMIEAARIQYGKDHWVSLMPSNLYGPGDNFDLHTSHVLPALIRKFHEAKMQGKKQVQLWGSGEPLREFLYVDDLAKAVEFSIGRRFDQSFYNVGFGSDISIRDLAASIQQVTGFTGEVVWDTSKPDGTPKKLMDSSRFKKMGWRPDTTLDAGIRQTYLWFLDNIEDYRSVKLDEQKR